MNDEFELNEKKPKKENLNLISKFEDFESDQKVILNFELRENDNNWICTTKEDEFLEFKEYSDEGGNQNKITKKEIKLKIAKYVNGFANRKGGFLVFGLKDKGVDKVFVKAHPKLKELFKNFQENDTAIKNFVNEHLFWDTGLFAKTICFSDNKLYVLAIGSNKLITPIQKRICFKNEGKKLAFFIRKGAELLKYRWKPADLEKRELKNPRSDFLFLTDDPKNLNSNPDQLLTKKYITEQTKKEFADFFDEFLFDRGPLFKLGSPPSSDQLTYKFIQKCWDFRIEDFSSRLGDLIRKVSYSFFNNTLVLNLEKFLKSGSSDFYYVISFFGMYLDSLFSPISKITKDFGYLELLQMNYVEIENFIYLSIRLKSWFGEQKLKDVNQLEVSNNNQNKLAFLEKFTHLDKDFKIKFLDSLNTCRGINLEDYFGFSKEFKMLNKYNIMEDFEDEKVHLVMIYNYAVSFYQIHFWNKDSKTSKWWEKYVYKYGILPNNIWSFGKDLKQVAQRKLVLILQSYHFLFKKFYTDKPDDVIKTNFDPLFFLTKSKIIHLKKLECFNKKLINIKMMFHKILKNADDERSVLPIDFNILWINIYNLVTSFGSKFCADICDLKKLDGKYEVKTIREAIYKLFYESIEIPVEDIKRLDETEHVKVKEYTCSWSPLKLSKKECDFINNSKIDSLLFWKKIKEYLESKKVEIFNKIFLHRGVFRGEWEHGEQLQKPLNEHQEVIFKDELIDSCVLDQFEKYCQKTFSQEIKKSNSIIKNMSEWKLWIHNDKYLKFSYAIQEMNYRVDDLAKKTLKYFHN